MKNIQGPRSDIPGVSVGYFQAVSKNSPPIRMNAAKNRCMHIAVDCTDELTVDFITHLTAEYFESKSILDLELVKRGEQDGPVFTSYQLVHFLRFNFRVVQLDQSTCVEIHPQVVSARSPITMRLAGSPSGCWTIDLARARKSGQSTFSSCISTGTSLATTRFRLVIRTSSPCSTERMTSLR